MYSYPMEDIVNALIDVGYNPDEAERMADRARKNNTVHVLKEYVSIRNRLTDGRDFDDCFLLSY